MRSLLLQLAVCCISLLSLQQLSALPVQEQVDSNRWDLLQKTSGQREQEPLTPETPSDNAVSTAATPASSIVLDTRSRLPSFLRHKKPTDRRAAASPSLAWARPAEGSDVVRRRAQRRRRHVHSRGGHHHHNHHPQLMRVGCVLGTCQVQNLSHRLYQLIGQSGREDHSPINPRSPHSYG